MNVRHPMGVLHSFSIKNIYYDEMDLRLFYFHLTICVNTHDDVVDYKTEGFRNESI